MLQPTVVLDERPLIREGELLNPRESQTRRAHTSREGGAAVRKGAAGGSPQAELSPTLRSRGSVSRVLPLRQETQTTLVIPTVTWQDAREEWVVDIYSRLSQDRIIFRVLAVDASRLP